MTRSRGVTIRIVDFTDVKGPAPKPKPPKLSIEEREARQRAFLNKVHEPGRLADERRKARVQYEEDVASGKRKPFFRKRRTDNRPTMWWLDKED